MSRSTALPRAVTPGAPTSARRALLGSCATLAVLAGSVLLAGPASAHVTVNPREAAPGGFAKLTFRVPTESPKASTTKLSVDFPTATPFASVSVKPHAGWTATVTRSKLAKPVVSEDLTVTEAVSRITWTAQPGAKIRPGQFDEFDVSVGPLPKDVPSLSFPAVQTYDDGTTVSWNQKASGSAEPEHPAPTLSLTAAGAAGATAAPAASASAQPATAPVADLRSTDGTARALGTAGLVVGALGLLTGAVAVGASRRREA